MKTLSLAFAGLSAASLASAQFSSSSSSSSSSSFTSTSSGGGSSSFTSNDVVSGAGVASALNAAGINTNVVAPGVNVAVSAGTVPSVDVSVNPQPIFVGPLAPPNEVIGVLPPNPAPPSLTGALGDAPVTFNNPPNDQEAHIRQNGISADFTFTPGPNGAGVDVSFTASGLPANLGPFPYHIHVMPVPPNGDCYGAGPHLDTYQRGEQPPCNSEQPERCQVGDLSGKHGWMFAQSSNAGAYNDAYLSLDPSSPAYIGGRSVVIHSRDDTRLACANLTMTAGGTIGLGPVVYSS